MSLLCAPSSKVFGFQVNFPDTAFTENGVFAAVIRTDGKSGYIYKVTQQDKLMPQTIARSFVSVVKKRRRVVLPGK